MRTAAPDRTRAPLTMGLMDACVTTRYDDLEALRDTWNAKVLEQTGNLYLTFEWVTSLWESHFNRERVEFLLLRDHGDLQGVVPLTSDVIRKHALSFHQMGLVTNSYGRNHNDLVLLGDPEQCLDAILRFLHGRTWDIWHIGSLPEDSPTLPLLQRQAGAGHYRLVLEPYVASPYLILEGDWETYVRGKSPNFRSDLKRKGNKAERAGMEFRTVTEPHDFERVKEEMYSIETRSWKETSRTSITTTPWAKRFYDVFLPQAARNGWLRLIMVYVKGTPVAYDMGVLYADKYYMLKTSYDQAWSELSPGIALRQFVIRWLYSIGAKEHDFLGDDEPWKMRWTQSLRRHQNIYLYNTKRPIANLYSALRAAVRRS